MSTNRISVSAAPPASMKKIGRGQLRRHRAGAVLRVALDAKAELAEAHARRPDAPCRARPCGR